MLCDKIRVCLKELHLNVMNFIQWIQLEDPCIHKGSMNNTKIVIAACVHETARHNAEVNLR